MVMLALGTVIPLRPVWTRTVKALLEGSVSDMLQKYKDVPQGTIVGPLLFTMYINNIWQNVPNAALHVYADDAVIYCIVPNPKKAFLYSQ